MSDLPKDVLIDFDASHLMSDLSYRFRDNLVRIAGKYAVNRSSKVIELQDVRQAYIELTNANDMKAFEEKTK